VSLYHRAADWGQLKRLLPAVVPGIVVGAVFLKLVSDKVLLVSVAACLFVAVGLQLLLRARQQSTVPAVRPAVPAAAAVREVPAGAEEVGSPVDPPLAARPSFLPAILAGVAAGFTTMVANAAGAVMSLYLLAIKADKARFVATGAWYYLLVNLAKVPFSVSLGLIHLRTLTLLATLVPMVLIGTWLGRRFLKRLNQRTFEWLTIAASTLSAAVLLLKGLL